MTIEEVEGGQKAEGIQIRMISLIGEQPFLGPLNAVEQLHLYVEAAEDRFCGLRNIVVASCVNKGKGAAFKEIRDRPDDLEHIGHRDHRNEVVLEEDLCNTEFIAFIDYFAPVSQANLRSNFQAADNGIKV